MKSVFALALSLAVGATAFAGEPAAELKSGMKDGALVPAFNVKDVTGPSKGESLCYRCQYGSRPVVSIFARKVDDNLAKLVKEVDSTVGKNQEKQMRAFVVVLTDDADSVEADLKAMADKHGIKHTPLTVYDGKAGPQSYKINKDADVTVLMWNKSRVTANHGFAAGKVDEAAVKAVVKETGKILN